MKIMALIIFALGFQAVADESDFVAAITMDRLSAVKRMINSGEFTVDSRINAEPYGEKGISPIALAAREASLNVATYLIEQKADLNARTSFDETALMLACFFGDSGSEDSGGHAKTDKIAEMLIHAGADVNNIENAYTPLGYAAFKDRIEIGQKLVAAGANVNSPAVDGKTKINTPLMVAAIQGRASFTKLLLLAGADVKIWKQSGYTALSFAKKYNQTHLIPWLTCAWDLGEKEKFSDKCL